MHLSVAHDVVLVTVETGTRGAVQHVALGAPAHGEDAEIVIEPEAGAEQLMQVGDDLAVHQHVAKRAPVRVLPQQGAVQVATAGAALQRLGAAGKRVCSGPLADLAGLPVDGRVGQRDIVG